MGFGVWNYSYDYPTSIAYSKLNYIKLQHPHASIAWVNLIVNYLMANLGIAFGNNNLLAWFIWGTLPFWLDI
jgi:hypothetical protein